MGINGPQLRFPRFIKKILPYEFFNMIGLIVSATRRRRNIKMVLCLLVLIKMVSYSKYSPWMNAKAWFFCFRPEIPVLGKFGPKSKFSL